MNKFIRDKMKRKEDGGEWREGWGLKSSAEDFYCPDARDAHKSTGKIQLSIICSDLIAMVTEQRKILIKPALATEEERWWKERQRQGGNEGSG